MVEEEDGGGGFEEGSVEDDVVVEEKRGVDVVAGRWAAVKRDGCGGERRDERAREERAWEAPLGARRIAIMEEARDGGLGVWSSWLMVDD